VTIYICTINLFLLCVLRSTQPLKVSTSDFSWGKGGRCVWLTFYHTYSSETSRKSGTLTYPDILYHIISYIIYHIIYHLYTITTLYYNSVSFEPHWYVGPPAAQVLPEFACAIDFIVRTIGSCITFDFMATLIHLIFQIDLSNNLFPVTRSLKQRAGWLSFVSVCPTYNRFKKPFQCISVGHTTLSSIKI